VIWGTFWSLLKTNLVTLISGLEKYFKSGRKEEKMDQLWPYFSDQD
jgi:hypothetical protein